uniref:ABC transporter ATP-binding protein n=1 Tax=Agathobacter sp. TaxID=2021311 RepID=UPI0040568F7B
MGNCIEICNLHKEIEGIPILSDVSVTLKEGKIYGFIGKNGSGKTMLFRTIAGLIKPSSGEIRYNNIPVSFGQQLPLKIGIMIENAGLYPELSAFDNLKFLASIRGTVSSVQIQQTIEKVGLNPKDKRKIKKYSLGMRQRLTFAQAILEAPDLLLLDEPTNALDVDGVQLIRDIIMEEKKRGSIICIASHNAEDIEILCDKTFKMIEGKLYDEKIMEAGCDKEKI